MDRRLIFFAVFLLCIAGCKGSSTGQDTAQSTTQTELLIVSANYENGAKDVPPDATFDIKFLKDVEIATVNNSTFFLAEGSICDPANAVAGTVSCSSTIACTFKPSLPLKKGADYKLCLTQDISYADGGQFPGTSFSFATIDDVPPTVLSVLPADGSNDVAVNVGVQAVFSKEMDVSSISKEGFSLRSSGTPVDGIVSYNDAVRTATFAPSSNLSSFAPYTATVSGSVKDKKGNKLGNDHIWNFTTSDIIAPTIVSVTPPDGATGVKVDTSVSAAFSEAMSAATITLKTFSLGGNVEGTVTYSDADGTATFDPLTNLSYFTNYTATLNAGAKDSHGIPLASNYSWTFKTEIAPTVAVAGMYHIVALKADGTVWTWGRNHYGQLGDGTTTDRNVPLQVAGLTGVTAVAAGAGHTLVLKSDGTVWGWGGNDRGELGDGTTTQRSSPVKTADLANIIAISAGTNFSTALDFDGGVWAWGINDRAQLGNGTRIDSVIPVQVSVLSNVKAIASGAMHNIALKEDGTVWGWGYDCCGQVGNGTKSNEGITTPVEACGWCCGSNQTCLQSFLATAGPIKAIAAGGLRSFAIAETGGTVWAWGANFYGELGAGDYTLEGAWTPVQVTGLANVSSIAAGSGHTVAGRSDGTVWTWGKNEYGQLGNGTTVESRTPVKVKGLSGISSVYTASYNSIALNSAGTTWIWGLNYHGELGDGKAGFYQYVPRLVEDFGTASSIGSGFYHTVVRRTDDVAVGTVWSHGSNSYGQLGNTSRGQSLKDSSAPVQAIGLTNVTSVAAGLSHTLALKQDKSIWAWGSNLYGELGDGTTTNRNTPVQLSGITGVKAIAAGQYFSLALKENGTVWGWGQNGYGSLGNGTQTDRHVPVQVSELADVSDIATLNLSSLALKNDGTVWAWGWNGYGQLGDGTTEQRSTPVQVCELYSNSGCTNYLSDVKAVCTGSIHSVALKNDGTVWTWGKNFYGQLGDGTLTDRTTPVQVHGVGDVGVLNDVAVIGCGNQMTFAARSDGTALAWGGGNYYGSLGDGTTSDRRLPVPIVGLTKISAITGGFYQTIAIRSDGTVWEWGWNSIAPLLDGTTPWSTLPAQVVWPK